MNAFILNNIFVAQTVFEIYRLCYHAMLNKRECDYELRNVYIMAGLISRFSFVLIGIVFSSRL